MGRKRSHIAVGLLTVGTVGLTGAAPALGIAHPAAASKAAPLHTLSVAGVGLASATDGLLVGDDQHR